MFVVLESPFFFSTLHQSVMDQVFRLYDSDSLTHLLPDTVSHSFTITVCTIKVMPGCKCQCIYVSWALLGSACQHLINVSACTQPRQPHMSIFTHACT